MYSSCCMWSYICTTTVQLCVQLCSFIPISLSNVELRDIHGQRGEGWVADNWRWVWSYPRQVVHQITKPLMRLSDKAASRMGHSQPASGLVDLEPTLSIHSVEYVYILCAYQCVNVQACASMCKHVQLAQCHTVVKR